MWRRTSGKLRSLRRQVGVMIVEFAIVSMVFLLLLMGIMEFGRWLFTLNAASEATRWGARLAVVCNRDAPVIKQKMRLILGSVTDDQIHINYSSSACDTTACMVTVSLVGATFTPMIPYLGVPVPIPPFTTSLTREAMDSAGGNNEVCQ